MGQCIKCGRETPHAYTYWTGDLIGTRRAVSAKNAKFCVNPQKHTAFLCTRCATRDLVAFYAIFSAAYTVLFAIITIDKYRRNASLAIPWSSLDVFRIGFYGLSAALFLGMLFYTLFCGRRDKKLPFNAAKARAEQRIVKLMRRQNPGKNYFAPSDYH